MVLAMLALTKDKNDLKFVKDHVNGLNIITLLFDHI